ncbi:MAG: Gfo/Idh/MocA family oxidoreductase [Phycisphaerae bacterium]|nr:Gfo/Idh/MocA family oxidoreductase [Phycisphaerae bacterium]
MEYYTTRRGFLAGSVAVAAAMGSGDLARGKSISANDKLDIAVIGVGGRGGANLGGVRSQNIVAICDVDANTLAGAARGCPKAAKFSDFRKMLDKMHKQIDAVVVSTPDHTHAPAAAMAMRMGKHCYCEKPLTHTVGETRTLIELASKNKLVTQMGTQIHAKSNYRRVVEIVQSGMIGSVGKVHVWHTVSYGVNGRPKDTPPVPKHLDWDSWLGPARDRPYHSCYVRGRWRGWREFGTGGLGDFGCHYMDLPFWALKLRHPTSIEADGPPQHAESTPRWLKIIYKFPARDGGKLAPVTMTWSDGGKKPAALVDLLAPLGPAARKWSCGVLFVGDKGMVLSNYDRHLLLPKGKFADAKRPAETIPASIGHHKEWFEACKTGGATTCNFAYSGALTEAVLLGVVAYRAGEKINWDAKNLKAINCPKADEYIREEYRKGWKL